MAQLSLSQIRTLKKHSEHHSKKHMDMMKKLMREGKSFKAAHTAAQKEVGKWVLKDGLKKISTEELKKCELVIIRINRSGECLNSKPCCNCENFIKRLNIKKVFHSWKNIYSSLSINQTLHLD